MRALLVEILLGIGANCELPFYSALDKWRTSFPQLSVSIGAEDSAAGEVEEG